MVIKTQFVVSSSNPTEIIQEKIYLYLRLPFFSSRNISFIAEYFCSKIFPSTSSLPEYYKYAHVRKCQAKEKSLPRKSYLFRGNDVL